MVLQGKLAKLVASSKERLALIEKSVDPALLFTKKKTVGQDPYSGGLADREGAGRSGSPDKFFTWNHSS